MCVNPEAKACDQIVRSDLIAHLEKRIAGSDEWTKERRDELVGELRATSGLARFCRRTKHYKLRVDKAAVARMPTSTASGSSAPPTTPSP